eukprot:2354236-Amphidinium_carterae.2
MASADPEETSRCNELRTAIQRPCSLPIQQKSNTVSSLLSGVAPFPIKMLILLQCGSFPCSLSCPIKTEGEVKAS